MAQTGALRDAGALSYTTLLSSVPLLAVMFGLVHRLFPTVQYDQPLRTFFIENFIPLDMDFLLYWLGKFQDKASHLALGGTIALLCLTLMLIMNVDQAINRIWKQAGNHSSIQGTPHTLRHVCLRLPIYTLILIFGGSLIGVGLAATSYVFSLSWFPMAHGTSGTGRALLGCMPYFSTSIALALLYKLLPRTRIKTRHAVLSGLCAAAVFELAKIGFGMYIGTVPYYQAIYGTMMALPLFLIWVYLSWLTMLSGAHLCFCMASHKSQDTF